MIDKCKYDRFISKKITCRSCGSLSTSLIGSKKSQYSKYVFDYILCDKCTYLFVNPFYGYSVYNDEYYKGLGPDNLISYEKEYLDYKTTDRVLEYDDIINVVSSHFKEKKLNETSLSWLDFGCGSGGMLKYLKDLQLLECDGVKYKIDSFGHDTGPYAEKLSKLPGIKIVDLDYLLRLKSCTFEVITLIEVIEHVERPSEVFELIARLLKPGGILVLTTGNRTSFIGCLLGLKNPYFIPEIHVGLFTPECLVNHYERYGLEPKIVRYSGVINYKVIKTVKNSLLKVVARRAMKFDLLRYIIDRLYGVSVMPCATKSVS